MIYGFKNSFPFQNLEIERDLIFHTFGNLLKDNLIGIYYITG